MISVSLTVVIPTYNSARFIDKTVMSISEKCAMLGLEEIIVVNDGSTDETTSRIKEIRDLPQGVNLRLIEMRVNVGQTNATAVGLSKAKSDFILTFDDDYKDAFSSVIDLLTKLKQEDLDFVVGAPETPIDGHLRSIASWIIRRIGVRLFWTPANFRFSSFCLYTRTFLDRSRVAEQRNFDLGWPFMLTSKYSNVVTQTQRGLRSHSNFNFRLLVKTSLPIFRYLIQRQTKLIGVISTFSTLSSTILITTFAIRFFTTGKTLPGFASLYLLLLLNLGLLGLIRWRVFNSGFQNLSDVDIRRVSHEVI